MAPRVLRRGPDYTLDVKTRVPTGQIQRTDVPDLIPVPDTGLAEGLGFLGQGLKVLGYSLKDFFNQNNQRNADKGFNGILPELQDDYNTISSKSVDQFKEINLGLLSKYEERIEAFDYNDKTKDKIRNSLANYSSRKMEQLYGTGISEDKVANLKNLDIGIAIAIKNEDTGAAFKLIGDASIGEDAWLDADTAAIKAKQVVGQVYFETVKNDLAELSYRESFDIITAQVEDEEENLSYVNYPELTGADRAILIKTITQAGTFEEQRKSVATYDATNKALNSLYSNESSVSDLYTNGVEGLSETEIVNVINTYEGQQAIIAARNNKTAADPVWGKINTGEYSTKEDILNHVDPNLTELTRKGMIDYLETGIVPFDPSKAQENISEAHRKRFMVMAANGDDPFSILRAALKLTGDTNSGTGLPELDIVDYNKVLADVQNKQALSKLTAIVKGAERDSRFEDPKTGLQNNQMFDEFVRTYTDLFYDQIHEQDPQKQMNIDQFRSMADTLIDTIVDEDAQEAFNKISRSNKNVGTGLLSGFASNKMEDAVTALNEGQYDAMRFIEPEAWSLFKRKMIVQYQNMKIADDEKPKGYVYDKVLRLYKDKIPVFTNDKGEEEMIVIVNNIPQLVSLDAGISEYKNLALGYSIGDRNAEKETMLKTGWFRIIKDAPGIVGTVDIVGRAFGGEVISPRGFDDFYIVYEDLNRGTMELRPFHGDPTKGSEIAAAIKNVMNPEIIDQEPEESKNIIDQAIIDTTPQSFYVPNSANIESIKEETRLELEKRGFGGVFR